MICAETPEQWLKRHTPQIKISNLDTLAVLLLYSLIFLSGVFLQERWEITQHNQHPQRVFPLEQLRVNFHHGAEWHHEGNC